MVLCLGLRQEQSSYQPLFWLLLSSAGIKGSSFSPHDSYSGWLLEMARDWEGTQAGHIQPELIRGVLVLISKSGINLCSLA